MMLKTSEERVARQDAMKAANEAPKEIAFAGHFTVQELAAEWKFSARTIKRLAEKDPDVVRLGEHRPGKRSHYMLRVPKHVALRLYAQLTGKTEKPAEKRQPARFRSSLVKRTPA